MTAYRARIDAHVSFTNGGGLSVDGFLLDVDGPALARDEVARLLLASLGLLLAGEVTITAMDVVEQAHKGTRGGPSDPAMVVDAAPSYGPPIADERSPWIPWTLVELSHPIAAGMITYPGLPAPQITPYLTRAESRSRYAEGTEFALDLITLIGNTGTYLDSPYHRYPGGTDLAGLPLSGLVDLPAVVVRVTDAGPRAVDANTLAAIGPARAAGAAVLLHTGDALRFGSAEYATDAAYLTRDGTEWLVQHGAALVGIDAVNIDAVDDGTRPAHSLLLAAGIPIVEHLTGLDQVPPFGARFSAVPPRIVDFGTFPVRAYASVPPK